MNVARLYSIDSRVSEQESSRTVDNQFYKDVFKKLIFAMEMHQNGAAKNLESQLISPR